MSKDMISGAITVPLVVRLSTLLRFLADSHMVLNGIRKSANGRAVERAVELP